MAMIYPPSGYSPSGIPSPKSYAGLVLAIQGLPPICKSKHGWRLVKDLLREILAKHGILDPLYGKPGMVHIKSSSSRRSAVNYHGMSYAECRTELVWAHCNMKTPEAAICAWWEIAGHTWWGHHLSAAVFPSSPWEVGCVVDSALPVNGKPPRELTIEFPVKLEGIFPRSKAKADALSVKDSGEDPSPKKRPIQAQDLRQVQRRCTSSIRNLAISCPPFDRISNQRSPPPPYTSSVKVENERRGRRTRRDPKRTAHGHTHMPIPKITVDEHVEATTNVYCGPIIIDGS